MELGWECPKCKNIYAPNTPFCLYCWFTNTNAIKNENEQIKDINFNIVEERKEKNTTQNNNNNNNNNVETTKIENNSDILINKNLEIEKIEIEIPKLNKESTYSIPSKWPDTKIFLSGIGHAKERAINREFKIPYILDSVIDFPSKPSKLVTQYFEYIKLNNIEYLMDSGAYTYMANPKRSFNLKDHLKQYCYYINEFDLQNFIELDLDVFMSIEEIENIRRKIYLETHKQPIIVYHPERGHDYWINMCKENDFVAIGGLVTNESFNNQSRIQELSILCDEAHTYNTRVHGLGFTPLTLLNTKTMIFDTVDSTSWNLARCGRSWGLNEEEQLIQIERHEAILTSELQEKDLKIWAIFSQNYKGGPRA